MTELEVYKNQRKTLKGSLTRQKTSFDHLNKDNLDTATIYELEVRLTRIESIWNEFNEVQTLIESIELSHDDEVHRQEFEDKYFKLVGQINSVIRKHNLEPEIRLEQGSVVNSGSAVANTVNNLVKLPPIKIPTFDGQYHNWLEFKDSFLSLVDSNESLTDIQRFYYLKTSLEKDVLTTIKSIEVTANNYQVAWQFLVDRYENKRLIIFNHIKAIMEHPHIVKESHLELRNLYDGVTKHLRSLKSLGEKTDEWDSLIIYIMSSKFDNTTRRDWEDFRYEGNLPTMADLHVFLKKKCEVLEKLDLTRNAKQTDKGKLPVPMNKRLHTSNSFASTGTGLKCFYCTEPHSIFKCDSFLKLSKAERISAAKRLNLCLNCLRSSHPTWRCKLSKCHTCKRAHNTMLHLDDKPADSGTADRPTETPESHASVSGVYCGNVLKANSHVLLSTTKLYVENVKNNLISCRALLDSGSQSNFITERFCKQLGLQSRKVNHAIKGVGQTLTNINKTVDLLIKSNCTEFSLKISCLVIPTITDKLPSVYFDKSDLNIPEDVNLADPDFNIPNDIDLLLGSDVFWSALCLGQRKLGKEKPMLQKTYFGWVIAGNLVPTVCNNTTISCLSINKTVTTELNISLDKQVEKFWNVEEISDSKNNNSAEDNYCESYFRETTRRDTSGKFVVHIPFKNSVMDLGDSREMALKRFASIERKLSKDNNLKAEYIKFMKEYHELEHMVECNEENENKGYYLPHHIITKSSSLTTKYRVVFDASAKTTTGLSLNDTQFVGPTLQQDLFSILVRFRKHKYVMTGDVSKMYRRILVSEDQTTYQKIFWRSDVSQPIQCYKLRTVTYGTASAPYLAIRCLIELANENENKYPLASTVIKRDFYIDDILTGADTKEQILQLQQEVTDILTSGGFPLRKWLCNDKELLAKFKTPDQVDVNILELGENEQNKTLGIYWNAHYDLIQYNINLESLSSVNRLTKRGVLSDICQVFDPFGLVSCIIVNAKLLVQKMWSRKLEWDEELPNDLKETWSNFRQDLKNIIHLKIPRQAAISQYLTIECHGFCDASEVAYAACIFIRCTFDNQEPVSNLLCAKSRIAPLKQISLPRLELCAAVLVANLMNKTVQAIDIQFNQYYLWTDSTITLAWIQGEPKRWKTFVANRVSEIQSLTHIEDWRHVLSEDNPADILSRGTTVELLNNCQLWWHGPFWFSDKDLKYYNEPFHNDVDIPEKRNMVVLTAYSENNDILELINKFSNLNKIIRIVAYVQRFLNKIKHKNKDNLSPVFSPVEIDDALTCLIIQVQKSCFPEEYHALINNKELKNSSKLLSLRPFIKDRVMRVGGRLRNANKQYDKKYPIILPKGHRLTYLILRNEHVRLLHCGVQNLLCSVREKYWPVSGRNACKGVVNNCVTCFKAAPRDMNYLMGDLPDVRVNNYLPFQNVGIDYGGPFYLKDRKGRGAKINKIYICLFICMCVKAVHIEVVSELTTEAFLAALKRFGSRRGLPNHIYSDNGTNFVGANNSLKEIYEFLQLNSDQIGNNLAIQHVHWHFIPARSPSFGGIWEAGIKSAKFHIKRVIGNQYLTFEEFVTVITQIEGILNSRPLCPLTNDSEDLSALTPAHFLIGRQLTTLPEHDLTDIPTNRLRNWQMLQAMTQHYWNRWNKEYLSELQTRMKWKKNCANMLTIGSLVLVKEDNVPSLDWRLGRIVELFPGKDGITRVCDVKVRGGVIRRALNRLCALPTET
ncbi:unnamed protein product [Callosobruchus maculatus]|uniref:Integrase catalytic domain-containing protein n=1 Tax=Callosobruchus maculatus TaxID=64391 RepID=A0A653DLF8_CALMS|nr:unnamed protein product [Callosobruchus maculatus]